MEPLINIEINDITIYNSLIGILYKKLSVTNSACINCSYDNEYNIKSDVKYSACLSNIISNVVFPDFLSFAFELSSENDNYNNMQFSYLIHYRNQIKKIIHEEFIFNDNKYKLNSIICFPSENLYTGYFHFCEIDDLDFKKGISYYYDDLVSNRSIDIINDSNYNDKINNILKYNPFILIYDKY